MENIPLQCSVVVTQINGVPALELRRKITNLEVLKNVVWCALHETPIVVIPKFNNRIQSVASLMDKGVVHYDKELGQYFFTI